MVISFCLGRVVFRDILVFWITCRFKIGGNFVRNVRFVALTCFVSSFWFSCGFAVFMGEGVIFFLKVSKSVVMLFYIINMIFRDIF